MDYQPWISYPGAIAGEWQGQIHDVAPEWPTGIGDLSYRVVITDDAEVRINQWLSRAAVT